MKCGFRFALGAGILLVIVLLFLNNDLRDLFEQYRVRLYVWSSMEKYLTLQEPQHQEPIGAIHGDKVIVIAKLEKEYTSWVAQELPEYVALDAEPLPSPLPLALLRHDAVSECLY